MKKMNRLNKLAATALLTLSISSQAFASSNFCANDFASQGILKKIETKSSALKSDIKFREDITKDLNGYLAKQNTVANTSSFLAGVGATSGAIAIAMGAFMGALGLTGTVTDLMGMTYGESNFGAVMGTLFGKAEAIAATELVESTSSVVIGSTVFSPITRVIFAAAEVSIDPKIPTKKVDYKLNDDQIRYILTLDSSLNTSESWNKVLTVLNQGANNALNLLQTDKEKMITELRSRPELIAQVSRALGRESAREIEIRAIYSQLMIDVRNEQIKMLDDMKENIQRGCQLKVSQQL